MKKILLTLLILIATGFVINYAAPDLFPSLMGSIDKGDKPESNSDPDNGYLPLPIEPSNGIEETPSKPEQNSKPSDNSHLFEVIDATPIEFVYGTPSNNVIQLVKQHYKTSAKIELPSYSTVDCDDVQLNIKFTDKNKTVQVKHPVRVKPDNNQVNMTIQGHEVDSGIIKLNVRVTNQTGDRIFCLENIHFQIYVDNRLVTSQSFDRAVYNGLDNNSSVNWIFMFDDPSAISVFNRPSLNYRLVSRYNVVYS